MLSENKFRKIRDFEKTTNESEISLILAEITAGPALILCVIMLKKGY